MMHVVRGDARAVEWLTEGDRRTGLIFRVHSYDVNGVPRPPVAIELRSSWMHKLFGGLGGQIIGGLSEGDEVEVRGRWRAGTLSARQVVNRTTGAHLRAGSGLAGRMALGAVALVVLVPAAAVFGNAACNALGCGGDHPSSRERVEDRISSDGIPMAALPRAFLDAVAKGDLPGARQMIRAGGLSPDDVSALGLDAQALIAYGFTPDQVDELTAGSSQVSVEKPQPAGTGVATSPPPGTTSTPVRGYLDVFDLPAEFLTAVYLDDRAPGLERALDDGRLDHGEIVAAGLSAEDLLDLGLSADDVRELGM